MIKNCFLTRFILKILIVSYLTLTIYSSDVRATESPPDDDAEFMSEMNEFLRHPDEPDIYSTKKLTLLDFWLMQEQISACKAGKIILH